MLYWTLLLAEEGGGGLFDLDATLPLMALQFMLLVAVLNVTFYKPLGKALDDREGYIRANQSDAKERLAKAEALAKQYETEASEVRRQSIAIVSAAEADAQKIAAQKIAEAQQVAQAQREQAQKDLDAQKAAALTSLEQQVDELSRQILDKVTGGVALG
ncbi:MAG: F0F1 ATP synthase subunit B' [Cyanobacteria bacterium J069]|nr:MAG: F0F1 ATP synthase subunit B' [Cyanobacteria bacterium J069]